jgi:predicted nucleic acid-binding protein
VIFVDTSFWIALLLQRDRKHAAARVLAEAFGDAGWLTTNHVVGETWTFLRRRDGHKQAVAFLDAVERSPRVRLAFADEALEETARAWLRRHDERPYSFVDATSFLVMRAERVNEALAFDGDFSAAGFVEVRP